MIGQTSDVAFHEPRILNVSLHGRFVGVVPSMTQDDVMMSYVIMTRIPDVLLHFTCDS